MQQIENNLQFIALFFRKDFDDLFGAFVHMEKEKELADCKDVLQLGLLFIRIFEQPCDNQVKQ